MTDNNQEPIELEIKIEIHYSANGIPIGYSVHQQVVEPVDCDRCHNKQYHKKRLPVDPRTLCPPCNKTHKALMAFTEE